MALDATKFVTHSNGGKQLHGYNGGADSLATMSASGYFNGITDRLHIGDVIHAIGTNNTTLDTLMVTSASGALTVTTVVGS